MPSYNQAQFLESAIQSVICQNYPSLEFVVRDGGSTDGSIEIIRSYEEDITRWESRDDGGQASAINDVWGNSTGELLGWLNSDDILAPGALHTLSEAARKYPDAVLFFGDCGIIDASGRKEWVKQMKEFDADALLRGKSFGQPSVFIRREVIEEIGLLDASLRYALDWSYFLKVLWTYPPSRIQYVPEVLSCSREYEGTKTRTGLAEKGEERREKLHEYAQKGIIPDSVLDRGLAGTYWVQGAEQFLAGHPFEAFWSGLRAVHHYPMSLFEKLSRLGWLLRERLRR
jgi:glycosyltransferase involved in cell wall biosynthesis